MLTPRQGTEVHEQPKPGQPAGAPKPGAAGGEQTAAEKKFEALKRRLKVDGEEIELEIKDEAMLDRLLQEGLSGQKRLHEASKLRKHADSVTAEAMKKLEAAEAKERRYQEDFLNAAIADAEASGDPKKMGAVRERVEKWLAQEIRKEMMSPEQRQALLEKQRADRAEKRLADIDAEKQKGEAQALEEHFSKDFQGKIVAALQTKKVPQTPRAAMAMADMMSMAIDKGYELNPEHLADFVRQDYIEDIGALTSDISKRAQEAQAAGDLDSVIACGDQLIEMFGEDMVNLIRRADIARIKRGQPAVPKPILETPRSEQGKDAKPKQTGYMTEDQYVEWRKKRIEAMKAGQPLPE